MAQRLIFTELEAIFAADRNVEIGPLLDALVEPKLIYGTQGGTGPWVSHQQDGVITTRCVMRASNETLLAVEQREITPWNGDPAYREDMHYLEVSPNWQYSEYNPARDNYAERVAPDGEDD